MVDPTALLAARLPRLERLARLLPALALVAGLLTLGATLPAGRPGPALLAAAVVAALSLALGGSLRQGYVAPARRPATNGIGERVETATAYWCAVPVPSRPRQPRAPGRA